MIFLVDIDLKSEANLSEHWTKRKKRRDLQSLLLRKEFEASKLIFPLPLHVILTRISPRKLDTDNLVSAFKHIRDEIADILVPGKRKGRADDTNDIRWFYDQRAPVKGVLKKNQIQVEINCFKK